MMHRISLVVATKDRPDDLRKLMESLRRLTIAPTEIVVVDASREPVEPVIAEFPELTTRYLRHWPPSASAQRNAGIRACEPSATLIGFVDDDTTFEPLAFANMLSFWRDAAPDILGAAFNLRNYPRRGSAILKHSVLAKQLGLYSARPGTVSLSGWQSMIGEIDETQFVDWIPSTAVIFRREVFSNNIFDEAFDSYSYLEDLDFTYSISRMGRLAVVANAGFSHFPSPGGRVSARQFGRFEVRNRIYFVRKHRLSLSRCYLGLAIRLVMSVCSGLLQRNTSLLERALGNIEAPFLVGNHTASSRPQSTFEASRKAPDQLQHLRFQDREEQPSYGQKR
ncbi:glycosyltransferase family 2 protein [Acidicapsa acidisoli]|uniref:glycosyltransferase family 2 protein n=1 Tax=Acidicapsa acidisoli TaxID=1615681 RepID=UPI0021DF42A2|nr:glycosyltransferase [Acidicapsa acidisoli]